MAQGCRHGRVLALPELATPRVAAVRASKLVLDQLGLLVSYRTLATYGATREFVLLCLELGRLAAVAVF